MPGCWLPDQFRADPATQRRHVDWQAPWHGGDTAWPHLPFRLRGPHWSMEFPAIRKLLPGDHAYGPVDGTTELRTAVAEHYNRLYRRGKSSQYTAENVCISGGGRLGRRPAGELAGRILEGHRLHLTAAVAVDRDAFHVEVDRQLVDLADVADGRVVGEVDRLRDR